MDVNIDKGLALLRSIPYYSIIQSKSKYEIIDVTLTVIAIGFEIISKRSPEMIEEISNWNNGRRFGLGVLPKGPHITLEIRDDGIYYLGKGRLSQDVAFLFKNLDSALMVLTAQMGSHQAVAECRVLIDGDNAYAMELNRALAIVETYLFPSFILNKIFKAPPKLTMEQLLTKSKVYGALMPSLIKNGL